MPGDAHQLHETVQVVLRTQPHTSDAGQLSVARLDESRLTEHVHVPQSLGQLEHDSLPLQVPSPQEGAQAPQSLAQDEHDSVEAQLPSPQLAAGPQVQLP